MIKYCEMYIYSCSQDPTFDKALHGMEVLQQQLHSAAADQDVGVDGVGDEVEDEEEDSLLGVRPLELEHPLGVGIQWNPSNRDTLK